MHLAGLDADVRAHIITIAASFASSILGFSALHFID